MTSKIDINNLKQPKSRGCVFTVDFLIKNFQIIVIVKQVAYYAFGSFFFSNQNS